MSICLTDFGRFRVKADTENINVGGRIFCVNISLREKETSLYLLKTDEGGCELNDKDIRGSSTVTMTDLAFSFLRKHHPERTIVTLLDDSGFSWTAGKRKYRTIFLKGYLLIHRKTWYEDKFDAVMCNPDIYKTYRDKIRNFDDPAKKPNTFDFIDRDAKEKLDPIYASSTTWGEFIDRFVEKYQNDKYVLMYHWYRSAIYTIFDGMEINQDWKIDISKRPTIECKLNGGTRKSFSKYRRIEPF